MHNISDLIRIFNHLFLPSENTVLVRGDGEPLYKPADDDCEHHQVIFAHGFYASALHEISHWCIAGKARRQLLDYGYWYEPDGRTIEQQESFAKVEAKPQALEWILNKAAGRKFVISLDNLNADTGNTLPFKQAVIAEIEIFKQQGLPPRAEQLLQAMAAFYQQAADWRDYTFTLEEIA